MKKGLKFTIILAFFLVFTPSVFSIPGDDIVIHYDFNNGTTDTSGNGNDGTASGTATLNTTTYKLGGGAYDFDFDEGVSSGKITIAADASINGLTDFTLNCWVYDRILDPTDSPAMIWNDNAAGDQNSVGFSNSADTGTAGLVKFYSGAADVSSDPINASEWIMVSFKRNSSSGTFFLNGQPINTETVGTGALSSAGYVMGVYALSPHRYGYDGVLDECSLYDVAKTDADILSLYNDGDACNPILNPTCSAPAPTSDPYAIVRVLDEFDNASLSGYNVTIGTTTNVTNSSGHAIVYNYTGLNYSIDGGSLYFNASGTATANSSVTDYVYGAFVTLEAFNIFGQQLNTFNVSVGAWTNQTTDGDTQIRMKPSAVNTVTVTAPNYISLPVNITPGGQDTGTYNLTGLYGTIYHFNATDTYNGGTLTGFNVSTTNSTLGGLLFNQLADASGWVNVTLVQGYDYFFQFNKSNYEYLNVTLAANSTSQFYQFSSLPAPSIDITFRDVIDGSIITDNMTITLTNNLTGTTNYSASGGFFTGAITPGNYTVEISSANYSESQYLVTVTVGAVYFLTAYLQYAPNTVIKQFLDSSSLAALPGVTVTQERVVNGTWQVLSSRTTDITGRTSFRYADDVAYRFTATKTGYDQKQYTLDPVLFDTYSVKLDRTQALDFSEDYSYVWMDYDPELFYATRQNNLTIDFISPSGVLTSYNYSIAYPGGTKTGSGSNSAGEQFLVLFNISGAAFDDRVYINLTYDTSIGDPRSFRYDHGIIVAGGNNTFIGNQDNTYGLGLLERVLIGTAIIIVIAGIIVAVAGSVPALLVGLFLMGFFIYIGFWEWWLAGISFLVGLVLIAARSD